MRTQPSIPSDPTPASRSWPTALESRSPSPTDRGAATGLNEASLPQLLQQRLRVLQVPGVEAFGEPVVDGGEEGARFRGFALAVPEAGETRACAEFERLGLLVAGKPKRRATCMPTDAWMCPPQDSQWIGNRGPVLRAVLRDEICARRG